jgi:glucarate dehydratase
MKITRIEYRQVSIPFTSSIRWASGNRAGTTRIILTVETDAGVTGIGETFVHFFTASVLDGLIPLVTGEDPHNIERIHRKCEGAGLYHHKRAGVFAIAGIEMACWDIIGKTAGKPLYQLLGGKYRDRVPIAAYLLDIASPESVVETAKAFIEQGYRTIKLKVGRGTESDLANVAAVRAAVGPSVQIRIDPNGAWTIATSKRLLRKLEPYDLEYVEQPTILEDLFGLAELRRSSSTPIAVDVSTYTDDEVLNVVRSDAADVILLDPHEAGGIFEARKAAAICEAAGVPVGIHRAGELGISTAAILHLVTALPNVLPAVDHFQIIADDVIADPLEVRNGEMTAPEAPGLGVELDPQKLDEYSSNEFYSPYLDPDESDWFPQKPQY